MDSKYHIKRLKSSRTCLLGYSGFIACEQFFIAWGVDTHTHAYILTKVILRNQACTWFNNISSCDMTILIIIIVYWIIMFMIHTHTHAYILTKVILRNQACTWFNNISSCDMTILIVYWIIMFMIEFLYNIVITDWNFTQS